MDLIAADEIKKEHETNDCQHLLQTAPMKTKVKDVHNSWSQQNIGTATTEMNILNRVNNEMERVDEIDSNIVSFMSVDIKEIKTELEEGHDFDSDNNKTVTGDMIISNKIKSETIDDIDTNVATDMSLDLQEIETKLEVGYDSDETSVVTNTTEQITASERFNGDMLVDTNELKIESNSQQLDNNMVDIKEKILIIPEQDHDEKQSSDTSQGHRKIEPKVFYTFMGINEKQVASILDDGEANSIKVFNNKVSSVDLRFGSHFLNGGNPRTNRFEYDEERKVYKCLHCTYETKGKSTYSAHFNRIHKVNQKVYQCPDCDYTTKERSHMMRHIKIKHDEHSKILECQYCEYKTKDRNGLNQHFRTKHEVGEERKCKECDYKTKSKASLIQHFKRQHDTSIQIIKCQFCPFKAKRHIDWVRHFTRKHDTVSELLKCDQCNYTTRQKLDLSSHFKRKHDSNVKYFPCDMCTFKAKSNADVIRHKKLKHDENAEYFQCIYCDYSSKLKSGLTAHCKRKHGLISCSLKCPLCEFDTKESTELTKHFESAHQSIEEPSVE